jgi:hypothetical protein
MRYCARTFTIAELELVRELVKSSPPKNRAHLSRLVCQRLGWYKANGLNARQKCTASKANGGLKEMSCRVAMLRMQEGGLITLPPAQKRHGNGRPGCTCSSTTPAS